jgi:hypothetical protein
MAAYYFLFGDHTATIQFLGGKRGTRDAAEGA